MGTVDTLAGVLEQCLTDAISCWLGICNECICLNFETKDKKRKGYNDGMVQEVKKQLKRA